MAELQSEATDVLWTAEQGRENDLVLRLVRGGRTGLLNGLTVPVGQGLTGRVHASMKLAWVDDYLRAATITHTFDREIHAEGILRLLAVPIERDGTMYGVLAIGSRTSGTFGSITIERARAAADRAALSAALSEHVRLDRAVAVHEERRRVAAELHDGVGALLFAIGSGVTSLVEQASADPDLADRLKRIQGQASEASVALRDSLRALRSSPTSLQLGVGLLADCTAFSKRTGIQSELIILEDPPEIVTSWADVVAGAVREALLNIEKHAGASAVVVTVANKTTNGRATLIVAVTDDGVGLADKHRMGIGLSTTNEAVSRIGGTLQVQTDSAGGTSWRIHIPC
jgi:signal transduction histidine kinase